MSIIHKPNRPLNFEHLKPVIKAAKPKQAKQPKKASVKKEPGELKIVKRWGQAELKTLAGLLAIKLSYKECGRILDRTAKSCHMAVENHHLKTDIQAKREQLIENLLNEH